MIAHLDEAHAKEMARKTIAQEIRNALRDLNVLIRQANDLGLYVMIHQPSHHNRPEVTARIWSEVEYVGFDSPSPSEHP